jgi:hypothetical protein
MNIQKLIYYGFSSRVLHILTKTQINLPSVVLVS